MYRVRAVVVACLISLSASPARAAKGVDGVVNINTADAGVLGLLPGIGPSKAAQIIVYRKRHPFRTVDELVRIRGIGRKMVRHLRVHLAVAGPTTAMGAVVPATVAPPPPSPAPPRPTPPPRRLVCARPALAVPKRQARPTHGVCARSP
jgi:competence protein ComEA